MQLHDWTNAQNTRLYTAHWYRRPLKASRMTFARVSSLAASGVVSVLVAFVLVGASPQAGFAQGNGGAQPKRVKMTFSGNGAPSAINLRYPDTMTGEENVAGNGTLGAFTLRNVTVMAAAPSQQPPTTCSGPNHIFFERTAGAGIFRFQDGSLLKIALTQGGDYIDLEAQEGHCTLILQITGGTGRFNNAQGTLTYTETAVPALADFFKNPVYFTETGRITGAVFGMAIGDEEQDEVH